MSNVYGLAYNYQGFNSRYVLPFWKCVLDPLEIYDNRIDRYIGNHELDSYPMWPEVELAIKVEAHGKFMVSVGNDVTRGGYLPGSKEIDSAWVHCIPGKFGRKMCKIKNDWRHPLDVVDFKTPRIAMAINGVKVQENNLSNMLLSPRQSIGWLSKIGLLDVGDILLSGTPPHNSPEIFRGDTIECWIEGIGSLKSYVT